MRVLAFGGEATIMLWFGGSPPRKHAWPTSRRKITKILLKRKFIGWGKERNGHQSHCWPWWRVWIYSQSRDTLARLSVAMPTVRGLCTYDHFNPWFSLFPNLFVLRGCWPEHIQTAPALLPVWTDQDECFLILTYGCFVVCVSTRVFASLAWLST